MMKSAEKGVEADAVVGRLADRRREHHLSLIHISCMGTMNGLMLGCCRGPYSLAARGEGPHPELFGQVDKVSNPVSYTHLTSLPQMCSRA